MIYNKPGVSTPGLTMTFIPLNMIDAEVYFLPNFLLKDEADNYVNCLEREIVWKQEEITLFGKKMLQPRLTAWYGDPEKSYTYAGLTLDPIAWTPILRTLKARLENVCKHPFNSVLLNYYRNGQDSVGWHSDAEPALGKDPAIASVSVGAERSFQFRHRVDRQRKISLKLTHGSLLWMKGSTQHHWQHQLPKTKRDIGPRINLTFRTIL